MSDCECHDVLGIFILETLPRKILETKRNDCINVIISDLLNEFVADESNGLLLDRKIVDGREILTFSCQHRTEIELLKSTVHAIRDFIMKRQMKQLDDMMKNVFHKLG